MAHQHAVAFIQSVDAALVAALGAWTRRCVRRDGVECQAATARSLHDQCEGRVSARGPVLLALSRSCVGR